MRITPLGPSRLTLLLVLAVALLAKPAHGEPSSYSRDSDGAKVLYLFLADLGHQVQRDASLEALKASAAHPAADVLVILGTAKAGVLAKALRWARDEGKLLLYAAPLTDTVSGSRCKGVSLGPLHVKRHYKYNTKKTTHAPSLGDLKVRPSACVATPPKGATTLAEGAHGAIVFAQALGKGKLLFFAHDDLLCNLHLDKDDVAVLLRRWLHKEAPAGSRVVFYEPQEAGKLWKILQRANLLPLLVHSLLFLLLIYWRVTPRFGDPTPARPPGRRAFAEHARALGGLYQRAGASGYTLHQLYERFLEKMRIREPGTKASGAKACAAEREQFAARLATRAGRPVEKVRSLLLEVERAAMMRGAKNAHAVAEDYRLGRTLAQLVDEAEGRRNQERSSK
ncbi:MAG: hypothetical protein JRH20_13780 [Deltaproteobacteria bacterium]|nr:hypothetical protein [Deltaproteobacteria bacterium]